MNKETKVGLIGVGLAIVGIAAINEIGIYKKESVVVEPKKTSVPRVAFTVFGIFMVSSIIYTSYKNLKG